MMTQEDWTKMNKESHYNSLIKQDLAHRKLIKKLQLERDELKKQLRIGGVSFELPSDDIFDMPEVDLKNPLEEFYYYERPAYLEDDQKQFRERLQKALNYLKGN
jgi:hypothetical protein